MGSEREGALGWETVLVVLAPWEMQEVERAFRKTEDAFPLTRLVQNARGPPRQICEVRSWWERRQGQGQRHL